MKKILLTAGVFLMASSAFAMPKVGDDATYAVTVTEGSQATKGSLEMQLASYDSGADQYDEKVTLTVGGQTQSWDNQVQSQALLSDSDIEQALSNCAAIGGKADNVTVPAGTFAACGLPMDDGQNSGTVWLAKVSFGMVKQDTTDASGKRTVAELQSQRLGQ
jgi:hypothetical protein